MTLHAQHMAYLPALRKYQRRMRDLRNHQKLLHDLQSSEPEWSQAPAALQNRELISISMEQVQKLQPSIYLAEAAIMDEKFVEDYMRFNSMVAALHMNGKIYLNISLARFSRITIFVSCRALSRGRLCFIRYEASISLVGEFPLFPLSRVVRVGRS